jgi:hypothetical protein
MSKDPIGDLVLIALILMVLFGRGSTPVVVVPPSQKATAAVWVYEKDDGTPPPFVMAAIDKLNRQGLMATAEDDDTRDASGEIAEQYKVPFAEAAKVGVPVFVVTAKDKLLKAIKGQELKTEEDVLNAAK